MLTERCKINSSGMCYGISSSSDLFYHITEKKNVFFLLMYNSNWRIILGVQFPCMSTCALSLIFINKYSTVLSMTRRIWGLTGVCVCVCQAAQLGPTKDSFFAGSAPQWCQPRRDSFTRACDIFQEQCCHVEGPGVNSRPILRLQAEVSDLCVYIRVCVRARSLHVLNFKGIHNTHAREIYPLFPSIIRHTLTHFSDATLEGNTKGGL